MKLLLVTFPVDLGNAGFEKRFISLFESSSEIDLQIFRFVSSQGTPHPGSIFTLTYFYLLLKRFRSTIHLWKAIRKAKSENRRILFMGVSPAMFAYFVTRNNNSYIVTDWTRKLYEPIWQSSGSPAWLTSIHQKVLNAQQAILGLTEAIVEQIVKDYDVPLKKVKKVKLPFSSDLEMFSPSIEREDNEIRILFVGGDFQRKGGDVLLQWFKLHHHKPGLKMTMVTGHSIEAGSEAAVEQVAVRYGQPEHIELFRKHDLFVLPTTCDSYPSVLGEAACAGLAILTTKNALGASEVIQNGINGYICDSQTELLDQLTVLVEDKLLISSMKRNSREFMEKEFSYDLVLSEYVQHIFE